MNTEIANLLGLDVNKPLPPPAPKDGPGFTLRFNNLREMWQGQRAAKALNISFNTYVRAVMMAHSKIVLSRAVRRRKRKANGTAASAGAPLRVQDVGDGN